jgi:hypothetical protein
MRLSRQPRQIKREYAPLVRLELAIFGSDMVINQVLQLTKDQKEGQKALKKEAL